MAYDNKNKNNENIKKRNDYDLYMPIIWDIEQLRFYDFTIIIYICNFNYIFVWLYIQYILDKQ